METTSLTAHELRDLLRRRDISSVEATRATLARIDTVDPRISAYVTVLADQALAQAEAADRMLADPAALDASAGPAAALCGVPLGIKDNMCTAGARTTCSSRMLENFVPPYDATTVARMRAAGAVFVGKTNLDEFAMGSSTENSAFGPTRNPWDTTRAPGGSSGGSAAAVAADLCAAATGSDTGGSIRQPAAFCGVVGMKPTYGLVSRYGLVACASSLDQIGPFTKDVEDCALMMNALAGHDPRDSTSANVPAVDYTTFLGKGVKGMRVGLPREFFEPAGGDLESRALVDAAIKTLVSLGAIPVEVALPHSPYALATYYLCMTAEVSSNLARYDGAQYGLRDMAATDVISMFSASRSQGFGDETKRRTMLGTFALSAGSYEAYYLKSLKVRTLIAGDFTKAFESCDIIAGPVTPEPAFKLGEKTSDPLAMYLSDIFTISVNLAGICATSQPCGHTAAGLPVGLQLIAPAFGEDRLFAAAAAFEAATDHHRRKPAL